MLISFTEQALSNSTESYPPQPCHSKPSTRAYDCIGTAALMPDAAEGVTGTKLQGVYVSRSALPSPPFSKAVFSKKTVLCEALSVGDLKLLVVERPPIVLGTVLTHHIFIAVTHVIISSFDGSPTFAAGVALAAGAHKHAQQQKKQKSRVYLAFCQSQPYSLSTLTAFAATL